jgi:hypothetical protein
MGRIDRMTEGAERKSRSSAKPSFSSPHPVDPENPVILSIQFAKRKKAACREDL